MAVFQFKLHVIPRISVLKKYGEIPNELFIDHNGWSNYNNNCSIEEEPMFEDARTARWWKCVKINIEDLVGLIDQIIPRAHYSEPEFLNWKGKSQIKEDNDASISVNGNKEIEDFSFRIDLRDPDKFPRILEAMLNICELNGFMVMDANGNLMEPNLKVVGNTLLDSYAVKFLIDPEEFLKEL